TQIVLKVFRGKRDHGGLVGWGAPARPRLLGRVSADDIPGNDDILSADALQQLIAGGDNPGLSFLGGGDVMLGGRARKAVEEFGMNYPLAAVQPLLGLSPIVVANVEGPC